MLKPKIEHRWDLSPKEAIAIQRALADRITPRDTGQDYETIAGIDVGLRKGFAHAAVVVMTLPDLAIVERAHAKRAVSYPYIPGLLTFREAPVILEALTRLATTPDLLMFDGQGYAHPRRMGLATHLGILLDHPSIGCAKSRLCGTYEEPPAERDHYSFLRDGDEVIGAVVRTRTRVKPVFVSVGNNISLDTAIRIVLHCSVRYRLPEPTRWAHRFASQTRKAEETSEARGTK